MHNNNASLLRKLWMTPLTNSMSALPHGGPLKHASPSPPLLCACENNDCLVKFFRRRTDEGDADPVEAAICTSFKIPACRVVVVDEGSGGSL